MKRVKQIRALCFALSLAVARLVLMPTGALAHGGSRQTDSWQFGLGIYGWFPNLYFGLDSDSAIRDINFNEPAVGVTFRW